MDAMYLHGNDEVVDTYLGIATPILVFISAISNLDCDNSAAITETWNKCLRIGEDLESWTCPRATSVDHILMTCAYRGAALIYLYRMMRYIQRASVRSERSVYPEHIESSKTMSAIRLRRP
jgi:hypothetical protein